MYRARLTSTHRLGQYGSIARQFTKDLLHNHKCSPLTARPLARGLASGAISAEDLHAFGVKHVTKGFEDEDEEEQEINTSFSQRLSRFKKSPLKKGRPSPKASDDDDDFIVPSDSEVETKSTKSSSSRFSRASRRSDASSEDEEQDEDEEPKKKGKSSGKSRSSQSKGSSKALAGSSVTGGSAAFLTAAEQREQGKKEEKKAAESPYSFLADNIKDAKGRKPDDPDYDPRTLYIKQFWDVGSSQEEDRFVLVVIGRNGAYHGVWSGAGTRAPLGERSQIQIASCTFHFILPPPPPPEDIPSPSSQSSANRLHSLSVDITSTSPPSSQPSHSPPETKLSPPPKPQLPSKPQGKTLPQSQSQSQLPNSNAIGKSTKTNSKKRKKGDTAITCSQATKT